ncbi:CcoQ/FixQ family Cbb3-type cytochrome c oxidase assembly chaperone [Soonwooa sp.]|uniref:CcoQ/FixQ family Cbb3-type cytochrome c oxidase assembly chaperone n=1 Tax=Soonwooa sp. TaxID=1938592 RepID=UPI0028AEB172|nr:CcoQ/FixQ family Cbb3-type cytochrome c oxidase assembly chaperone [Soonwooa sp.]
MIPQSFKDIISNVEYAGLLNTLSLILFIIVFVGITLYVFNRPKKYYEEEENAPLNDDLDMDDDENRTSH